eukprot:gene5533-11147_t
METLVKSEPFIHCMKSEEQRQGDIDKAAGENTGRWTREEHNLFLRGLELHGKGWKKIAALIKSRTVVQIRTHAQKYFLKMHKARLEGDSSGNADGRSNSFSYRKVRKRRYDDIPLSLAPALKPFVRTYLSLTNIDNDVTDDGLYNFLSPHLQDMDNFLDSTSTETLDMNALDDNFRNKIPKWFQNGSDISILLDEAGKLNWMMDPGIPLAASLNKYTNTMCKEVKEGMRPPPISLPIVTFDVPSTSTPTLITDSNSVDSSDNIAMNGSALTSTINTTNTNTCNTTNTIKTESMNSNTNNFIQSQDLCSTSLQRQVPTLKNINNIIELPRKTSSVYNSSSSSSTISNSSNERIVTDVETDTDEMGLGLALGLGGILHQHILQGQEAEEIRAWMLSSSTYNESPVTVEHDDLIQTDGIPSHSLQLQLQPDSQSLEDDISEAYPESLSY